MLPHSVRYNNFDGQIYHAISTVAGPRGIAGPYHDLGVVLRPDNMSQSWEGLQGTDSISPPFVKPGSNPPQLLAFYGSCHAESPPPAPYNPGRWNVGLASLASINSSFLREPFSTINPVDFNHGYAENPIVTWAPKHQLLLAVFDSLNTESQGFGLAVSSDGLNWSAEQLAPVPEGARTPLRLHFLDEAETTVLVFYTRRDATNYEMINVGTFEVHWP